MLNQTNSQDVNFPKLALILTTLLFLIIAPAPDSQDIAEMTADLLVPTNHSVLMADE
jgi:hypothetical protein